MPLHCRENTAIDFEGEIQYLKELERERMNSKLFVYGILRRGFELDLSNYGATFLGEAYIPGAALYGIGCLQDHEGHPNDGREYSGAGLRLGVGPNQVAYGELWEIPNTLWQWLDQIEQNGRCYTRKVVDVFTYTMGSYGAIYPAWVYEYSHPNGLREENLIASGRF